MMIKCFYANDVDLPDDLMRRAKATVALRGIKLKDLIAGLLEEGVGRPAKQTAKGGKGPLPSMMKASGAKNPLDDKR